MLPVSLYGRAVLILLLPVVLLQLVVSVAFIQRHFEDVTRQMTRGVVAEIALVTGRVAADPADGARIAAALGLTLTDPPGPVPPDGGRLFYDLSGRVVADELRGDLPALRALAFDGTRAVTVWIGTEDAAVQIAFPRRRVSASNPHQLLVLMAVFGAILTFIAYLFLRNQLRPIARLAQAAADYGRGRVVPYRPGGAVEVRAAGAAFLDMRNRIERQAQSRNLMLSGISHDLRTPLTRMRLGLAMIDDPEAEALRRDVDEMGRMVDAFLDFARGDAGDALEEVDLVALVAQVVADAGRLGGGRVTFLPVEGAAAALRLRPLALRRAVENLVGNALRHGSRAEVSLHFGERAVRVSVADDGPGIPPDRRDDALRPFVRLDDSRNQDQGAGVGLGLAIVTDIARSHGGSLRLGESATLGGLQADLILAR